MAYRSKMKYARSSSSSEGAVGERLAKVSRSVSERVTSKRTAFLLDDEDFALCLGRDGGGTGAGRRVLPKMTSRRERKDDRTLGGRGTGSLRIVC